MLLLAIAFIQFQLDTAGRFPIDTQTYHSNSRLFR
jgi:hypothetical protein